ncbi:MAG: CotH kinase family protein [Saprospiraceae bacterium]|nr:CotH kinase family protein [Saprospiraceae bacterium]
MKHFLVLLLCFLAAPLFSQSTALYDDSKVSEIRIFMPQDSLTYMFDQLVNDHYLPATFVFADGPLRDTVAQTGIRLRGNTSLNAQKKSFKISFNEFVPGRKYQGVKKLNLRGSHNDPTMIREKLFYEVWNKAGMPRRRVAFVKVFINNEYRGLYSNVEEIDKEWLEDVYSVDTGNLFKCTYPADLNYSGGNENTYKIIMNNPETRAYDLTTNETEDDYSRLVQLITVLNQPVNAAFPEQISAILNVESVLKSFALDVVSGNWDDYFYNKNNYYLYDNPATGRFEYFTFDTDNTFGVDWLNKDWARRDCLAWQKSGEPRPLATKLLAVTAYRNQFIGYLDSITRYITCPDSIFPRIDALHNLITPAAFNDVYRTLDYGYTMGDFHDGFTQTIDGHTPYGIKPFLSVRYDSTLSQIDGLVSNSDLAAKGAAYFYTFPNPTTDWLYIQTETSLSAQPVDCAVYDKEGRLQLHWEWNATAEPYRVSVQSLPPGWYQLYLKTKDVEQSASFVKSGN